MVFRLGVNNWGLCYQEHYLETSTHSSFCEILFYRLDLIFF